MIFINPLFQKFKLGLSLELLGTFIALGLNIIFVPIYLNYLSLSEYGIWLLLSNIISFVFIIDIGTDQYIETKVADDNIFHSQDLFKHIYTVGFYKIVISVIIILLTTFCYVWYFYFDENNFGSKNLTLTFILFFLSSLITWFSTTFYSILHGRSKINQLSLFTSVYSILGVLLNGIFLFLGFKIIAFSISALIISLLTTITYLYYLKNILPLNSFKISDMRLIEKENIAKFSFSFFVLKVLFFSRNYYPTIAIGMLFNPTLVSTYNLYNKVPQLLSTISSKVSLVFFPSFINLISKNDSLNSKNLFFKINDILFTYSLTIGLFLIFSIDTIISFWLNNAMLQPFAVTFIMLFQAIIMSAMSVFGIIVYSFRDFGNWIKWIILEFVILVFSSLFLGNFYGYIGFIYAFLLSTLINQVYLFFHVLKKFDVSFLEFFKEVLFHSILKNIPPFIILFSFKLLFNQGSFINILFVFFILLIVSVFFNSLYEKNFKQKFVL